MKKQLLTLIAFTAMIGSAVADVPGRAGGGVYHPTKKMMPGEGGGGVYRPTLGKGGAGTFNCDQADLIIERLKAKIRKLRKEKVDNGCPVFTGRERRRGRRVVRAVRTRRALRR